jgi:hypothetical protein
MTRKTMRALAFAAVLVAAVMVVDGMAQDKQAPKVQIPNAGVPEIMTIEGAFVRGAYNNEGYVILGYRTANESVGEPWIVLDVGTTLRSGQKYQKLTREEVSLSTPDGKTVPLPSNSEFVKANLAALERRASVTRDSINYFPTEASKSCRIGFFAEISQRAMSWDEVELDPSRACLGRLYFPVEGGIQYGQYFLNIKFDGSLVRVPFRILTKEEEKMLNKNYKSIEKQVKEAFTPKKK